MHLVTVTEEPMTATKTPAFHKPPLFTRQQLIALLLPLIAEQAQKYSEK